MIADTKGEAAHVIQVLKDSQQALINNDAYRLQQLSDQTIHSASIYQHTDFITIAVLMYSLNKIVLRKNKLRVQKWPQFVKKFNNELEKAITSLAQNDSDESARHIEHAKDLLTDLSPAIKQDVQEVIRRASVNKATRIYEHGISLQKTAKLLGVSQWELADYIGNRNIYDNPLNQTIDEKKRARMAWEFFTK
jgi:transcriptional regulator of aromatic amino acid metabolism